MAAVEVNWKYVAALLAIVCALLVVKAYFPCEAGLHYWEPVKMVDTKTIMVREGRRCLLCGALDLNPWRESTKEEIEKIDREMKRVY